jgi:uncharacterized protein (DUF2062 family)
VLYPVQCFAANRLIGGGLSYQAVAQAMNKLIEHQDYGTLFSLGRELVVSFFLGGAILAAVCVPITYFTVKRIVVRYRSKRA